MAETPEPSTHHRVTFFTRRGCHLCDKIWPALKRECDTLGLLLDCIDVDTDPRLAAEHGDWVPVVALNGQVRLRGIIDPGWLKRELREFSARPPGAPVRIRVGVAIVYDNHDRMLVNRRPEGGYYGGWWEWPGGKCNPGESPLTCAIRELREEIGIHARHWRLVERRRVEYPGRSISLWFHTARAIEGMAAAGNAFEHTWLAPAEVRGLKFLEPNLPVLERLIADGHGLSG